VLESAPMSVRAIIAGAAGMGAINSRGSDFWQSWGANPIDATNYRTHEILKTALGEIGYHWSHFSLWGTLDVGANGIGPLSKEANNPERYYWMDDVPRIKCFLGTLNGNTLTSNIPIFSKYDLGSTIAGGVNTITITAFFSANTVTVTHTESSMTKKPCAIGTTRVGSISSTGGSATARRGTWEDCTVAAADIGKLIWFSDGTVDVITGIDVGAPSIVEWIRARDTSGTPAELGFAIQPTYSGTASIRYYRDIIPDNDADVLRVREGFLLPVRFLEPLPCGNVGAVVPGFVMVGISGGRVWCYSCTGDQRFGGYFHPAFQADATDFGITALSEFEHAIIGYGRLGYALWDLTDTKIVNDESAEATLAPLGRNPITILRTRKNVRGIGCLSAGAVCKAQDGYDLVVTQNKEVRIFDGYKFGDNLIALRYQTKFDRLQAEIAMHFDKRTGLLVWGTAGAPTD